MAAAGGRRARRQGQPGGAQPGKGGKRAVKPSGMPQGEPPGQRQDEPPSGVAGRHPDRLARAPATAQDGGHDDKYDRRYGDGYGGKYGGRRSGKQNGGHKQNGGRNDQGDGGGWRSALLEAVARGWRERAARAALGACLLALWGAAYFGVAHSPLVLRARHEVLPWDRAIPFTGWAVWIYLAGLPMIAAPLLLLRPGRPLRRVALAYLMAIVVAIACFAAFPVASSQLRMAASGVGLDPPTALALAALRALDPPFNSFPSLHVALGALAAWSMGDAAPRTRALWNLVLALVAWSVCAIKQHAVLDVAGGLALALAVRAWVGAGAGRAQRRPRLPKLGGRQPPLDGADANRLPAPAVAAGLTWGQALARGARARLSRRPPLLRGASGSAHQLPRAGAPKAFGLPLGVFDRNEWQRQLDGAEADRHRPAVASLKLRRALARYAKPVPSRLPPLSHAASQCEHQLPQVASPKPSDSPPRLLGRDGRAPGGVGMDRRLGLPSVAGWNWRRALALGARSNPSPRRSTATAARPSWRLPPRAALPFAVVFALFVVYYVGAA